MMIEKDDEQFVSPEVANRDLYLAVVEDILAEFKQQPLLYFPYILSSQFETICIYAGIADIESIRYTCKLYYKKFKSKQQGKSREKQAYILQAIINYILMLYLAKKVSHLFAQKQKRQTVDYYYIDILYFLIQKVKYSAQYRIHSPPKFYTSCWEGIGEVRFPSRFLHFTYRLVPDRKVKNSQKGGK